MNDKTEKEEYVVRIALDSVADAEWIGQIAAINSNIPVTAATYKGKNAGIKALLDTGKTLIKTSTQFQPKVYDKSGNEVEDMPMFFADSKGTAKVIVQPYQGKKGGSINLIAVVINSMDAGESASGTSREERLGQLRAALQEATTN
jgi:hypothetical protein